MTKYNSDADGCDYSKCSLPSRELGTYYISETTLLEGYVSALDGIVKLKRYFHPRCHVQYMEEKNKNVSSVHRA